MSDILNLREFPKTNFADRAENTERVPLMRYRSFVGAILIIGALAWTSRANATFTTIDAPGAANGTSAGGINAGGGQIVGGYSDAAGNNHALLLDHGTVTTIDFPVAACTHPNGINARGQTGGGDAE